jgi:uncharacterized protein (DUF58 family)
MRLFDETALRKLEQLTLTADSVRVGGMKGDRRSRKRGTSIEFADYREYAQGDDLRRLDWNVYARLERPFIKLTEEEEDLAVHILVDTSASMNWPLITGDSSIEINKLRYALTLASAVGYIGLLSGDLVFVTLFDSRNRQSWGPFRGRQNGWPLIQFLEANYTARLAADGATSGRTTLNSSLRDYALRAGRPGLLFLISDLLSPDGFRDGLNAIQSRGHEVAILHLHSPDEINPELSGDFKLIDVETNEDSEVTFDPLAIEEYFQRLAAWHADIGGFCGQRGIHYSPFSTATPWELIILRSLRRQGVVR